MKVFYRPNLDRMAEIPAGSDGGVDIVAMLESGAALCLNVEEHFRGHVDAGHCYVDGGGSLQFKAESEWPENKVPAGGEA